MSGLYSTPRWRRLRATFRRDGELRRLPCGICRRPIDYRLQHPDDGSFQADHIKPARDFPELFWRRDNLSPAHKACNEGRHADPLDTSWVQPTW